MEIRVPFDHTQQALSSLCPRETDGWGLPATDPHRTVSAGHRADGGGPALGGCDLPRPRWPGVRYPNLNYVHLCQQPADKEMKVGDYGQGSQEVWDLQLALAAQLFIYRGNFLVIHALTFQYKSLSRGACIIC